MVTALCRPLSASASACASASRGRLRLLSSLMVIQPRFPFASAARTRNLSFLGIWTPTGAGRSLRKPEIDPQSLPRSSGGIGIRAAHVNDAGSIDSPIMLSMETKIMQQLGAESVCVKDAYGDGRHVSIEVVASCFEGKSAVNRQRMVYKAIWEELQTTVHAVDQMTTRTPDEVSAAAPDK